MEEVPRTEPENSPQPEPLPKSLSDEQSPSLAHERPARKKVISFRKVNHQLTTVISISLKLIGMVAVFLLLLAVVRELRYSGYQLQEVHVPQEFEEAGITGNAIAAQITAHIQTVKNNVEHNVLNQWNYLDEKTVQNHFLENSSNEVQVELVGVGLSLKSVVNLISSSLGISQAKKIVVFIKMNDGKAKLSVYVQDELPMEFEVNANSSGLFQAADRIAENAAESILKISNTEMLMYYLLYRTGSVTGYANPTSEERGRVVELAKFALKHDSDPSRYKYYYSFWGWALMGRDRNNAEAYEKYKRALSYDHQFVGAYTGMGWAMRDSHQYKKARESVIQAIRILESKNTRIPENRRTHMLQWCYNDLGKYYLRQFQQDTSVTYLKDSAFYCIAKSAHPAPDGDKVGFYSSIAGLYLNAGLRDSGQVYFQKALTLIPSLENDAAAARYNDISFMYSEAGRYDSALIYAQKAIQADSSVLITYTTLAEIYGHQKDREKFYYYVEKAFEKEYQGYTQDDLTNPVAPYSFYNKEDRYKNLWKRYVK